MNCPICKKPLRCISCAGAKGGKATSQAKRKANRAKAVAYWQAVRDGAVTHKGRGPDKRARIAAKRNIKIVAHPA